MKDDWMLRIAHLETSANMGGQELRILDQIQWLLSNGHSTWLLAPEDSAIYKEATRRGLPTHAVPFRGSLNPQVISRLVKFAKREKVHVFDCHSSISISTAVGVRILGIPVVRTLHVQTFKTDIIHKYLWRCGIDRVIVVSQGIADRLVGLGFANRDKISVIPTGIDLNRFGPDVDGSSLRRELDIPESTKVISEIAMIRPDKGQKYFIRAVDRVASAWPDVRFLIVGSATRPEFFEELKEEIAALRHRDKVIMTGFRKDVEKVIAASDLIVNSSPWEPRSQVIHQAFAMKTLVVASNKGGNLESISDGETGFLFRSEDVGSLSKMILSVLDNHTGPIKDNAYLYAHSALGIDTMMEKTLSVYRMTLTAGQSLQG
ncbi:MAG: glycosyltransferase family 4 protein [Syntrophales bacterium]